MSRHSSTEIGTFTVDAATEPGHLAGAVQPGLWTDLTGEQRAALVSLVEDALQRLAGCVDAWLPTEALAVSNTSFGFCVRWDNRYLEERIMAMRAKWLRDSEQRIADLKDMAGPSNVDRPSS